MSAEATASSQLARAELESLCAGACAIAVQAAEAIMAIYRRDFDVAHKADASPLTEADTASHQLIEAGLKALVPRFPVLSEESSERVFADRKRWRRFWLIDPLDGTREFVKRNGEFAVNIALIENGLPVIGIIAAPDRNALCYASAGGGTKLQTMQQSAAAQQLCSTAQPHSAPRVALSRSHHNTELQQALSGIGPYQADPLGSSLKFIALAQGALDLYPRAAKTCCEWDIAAGQCILEEAGGALVDLHGQRMRYNARNDLFMPAFVAMADPRIDWLSRLQWQHSAETNT
jgi:3'(2'), 5'-bisphosphate nucleotidase